MTTQPRGWTRRRVLRGLGGAAVGLPMLEAIEGRRARAAADVPRYAFFMINVNGVMQADSTAVNGSPVTEPEMFWPRAPGKLTTASLQADLAAPRGVGELADHAQRLLIVRGVDHAFNGMTGCGHISGDNEVLTAARMAPVPDTNKSVALGESIDNRIARQKSPGGRAPLALGFARTGQTPSYGYVSYQGPQNPRAFEGNPWNAYQRLLGLSSKTTDIAQIMAGRKSVNDLLRVEVRSLLARTDLTALDRRHLDQHFAAIRDLEIKMVGALPADEEQSMRGLSGKHTLDDNRDQVIRLHMDIAALAFASDYTRAATLMIGDSIYTIDGKALPRFHQISHRILSDGGSGPLIEGATMMHHQIDRVHARHFKYFIDRLAAQDTPYGKLSDLGFAAWTNQLAVGSHKFSRIPWVIAGSGGGFLKTGLFVDLNPRVKSNKMFDTLLNAAGLRKAGGAPVDDFGDPSLPGGLIPEIVA